MHSLKDTLFRRYANPLDIMASYSMWDLFDFILFMYDKEQEDTLWELWLSSDMKEDFKTFKKKRFKPIRKKKVKSITKERERVINDRNSRFIKPREDGETNE